MSISVIAKRIDNGVPDGGQGAYAHDLLEYMTNPSLRHEESLGVEKPGEKCVAVLCENFSEPVLSYAEMAAEMAGDCALPKQLQGKQGIDHWVLSFKGDSGQKPTVDQALAAAKIWIAAMGYGEPFEHKWAAAVHADTAHVHVHLAICRVNSLTGKVRPRGWWKNDNQKALAQIAAKLGFSLEPGAKIKVESVDVPDHALVKSPGYAEIPSAPDTLEDPEQIKILRESLRAVYDSIKDRLPQMKWGQIHLALSYSGLQMDRVERNSKPELVFSSDGEHWAPASKVCPELAWERLDGHIGAKSGWRKANRDVQEELVTVRGTGPDYSMNRQKAFSPGDRASRIEDHRGIKSDITVLHERLQAVYTSIKDNLPRMKWGQIHLTLARAGLQMDRVEHGSRPGLVFSMDGQNWVPASRVCPELSWERLDSRIGAKTGWRKANRDVEEELLRAREAERARKDDAHESSVEPTAQARQEVGQMLSKEEIQGLRQLPMEEVRKALAAAGYELFKAPKKPVRNGLDVAILEAGLSYPEACQKLAELFPEAVEAGRETGISSYREIISAIKAEDPGFHEYRAGEYGYEVGQEIVKWWRGLQLDSIDIHSMISPEAKVGNPGIYPFNARDMKLDAVLKSLPQLIALTSKGKTEVAPIALFCAPKWRRGKIGIMVDDLRDPSLLEKFPPTAVVATSDRKPQAFWVVDQRYEKTFYDDFMHWLNEQYGDPKILRQGHDTRLGGFPNQKRFAQDGSGRTPRVHQVSSSTRRSVEMEGLIEDYYKEWEKGRPGKLVGQKMKPDIVERESAPGLAPDGQMDLRTFMSVLRKVAVPQYLIDTGLRARTEFEAKASLAEDVLQGADLDRSQVDSNVARLLYAAGATPHEVYSFLLRYACQTESLVTKKNLDGGFRRTRHIVGPRDMDRKARLTAANLAPPEIGPRDGYRARHADRDYDAAKVWKRLMPLRSQEYIKRAEARKRFLEEKRIRKIEAGQQMAETLQAWRAEVRAWWAWYRGERTEEEPDRDLVVIRTEISDFESGERAGDDILWREYSFEGRLDILAYEMVVGKKEELDVEVTELREEFAASDESGEDPARVCEARSDGEGTAGKSGSREDSGENQATVGKDGLSTGGGRQSNRRPRPKLR